jgi:predicted nucleotidyltransferase
MRITEQERQAIISVILRFDENAEIHLFGSRLDDSKRGGDIDILIKSDVVNKKMLFLIEEELFTHIDEQKLDFVLTGNDMHNTFARMVLARGTVKLWEKKKSPI